MFYLTMHSTHFIYGYMVSDIWLRTILIVRKETHCRHIGYYFWLAARVLLYAPSHRQDSTYHRLCYTSRGALAGTRNSSMGPLHEGSIRRPITPWANALTMELHLASLLFILILVLAQQRLPPHPREDFPRLVPSWLWTENEGIGSLCTDSTTHIQHGRQFCSIKVMAQVV